MTSLARRRSPHDSNCWHVYYGDVRAGTIVRAISPPNHAELWQWYCGFYPGSQPHENTSGSAETFDQARKAFEAAWGVFLAAVRTKILQHGVTIGTLQPGCAPRGTLD
jgi:hypothetical protein